MAVACASSMLTTESCGSISQTGWPWWDALMRMREMSSSFTCQPDAVSEASGFIQRTKMIRVDLSHGTRKNAELCLFSTMRRCTWYAVERPRSLELTFGIFISLL